MEHLIIVETDITNPIWVREYLDKVTPLVVSYGGSYKHARRLLSF
jgi:uncharacterized protein (DUF1330 family)